MLADPELNPPGMPEADKTVRARHELWEEVVAIAIGKRRAWTAGRVGQGYSGIRYAGAGLVGDGPAQCCVLSSRSCGCQHNEADAEQEIASELSYRHSPFQ